MLAIPTSVVAVNIVPVGAEEEEREAGVQPAVTTILHQALFIQPPIEGAPAIPVPAGQLQWEMSKEDALHVAEQYTAAAEALPDPKPEIPIASSLAGVDEVARQTQALREGPPQS